jgi:DNA-binding Lrp family transcriptional regulator
MTTASIATNIDDPTNAQILAVSEDKVQGFTPDPLGEISRRSGVDLATVQERIVAMLRAGTIRRVRQTLLATNLAAGALVAWVVPPEKLNAAFDYMFQEDPFSGHVVIRSTDTATSVSRYRLWTTLKVPQGYSMEKHCRFLCEKTGAEHYILLPAKRLFALGVGHVRRRGLEPGSKADALAEVMEPEVVKLSDLEWRVLIALKREFDADEIKPDLWYARALEAGVDLETFCGVATELNRRGVIGRFSTFLEHVKPLVPKGREIDAGRQIGRFHIMTHAYWREAGPEFGNVNLMGVAHGTDKQLLLAHKQKMDEHLKSEGIEVSYTNVFWGGRSEIKPSEISPAAYAEFCRKNGIDAAGMAE